MSGPTWRPGRLAESALRLCFAAGGLVLALASLAWAVQRWRAWAGAAEASGPPAVVFHAVLMSLGFFPLFFAGFAATSVARWLGRPPLPSGALAPTVALALIGAAGLGLAWVGPSSWAAGVAGASLLAMTLGWLAWLVRLAGLWRDAGAQRGGHAAALVASAGAGVALMAAATAAAWTGDWGRLMALARAAAWGFVGTSFLAAGHRMVPFLSGLPAPLGHAAWPLPLAVLTALAIQAAAALGFDAGAAGAWLSAGVGAALVTLAATWAVVQKLRARMLAMLFAGFLWLGLALMLAGAQRFWPALAGARGLHAFTMGFMGSIMLAMLSRMSAMQVGVNVVVDAWLWRLFLLLQLAVACRVAGAASSTWLALAATLWAGVWCAWLARYGRWLGLARGDVDRP